MPTVFEVKGFRFFFRSADGIEPVHVHVGIDGRGAKFWLDPVRIARNYKLSKREIRFAYRIVKEEEKKIKKKWQNFFRKKS